MIDDIQSVATTAIVVIMAIAAVLTALEYFLGWPDWLVSHFAKRRRRDITAVLEEAGFVELRQESQLSRFNERVRSRSEGGDSDEVRKLALELLRTCYTSGAHFVGRTRTTSFPYYIDAMSATLREEFASTGARLISRKLILEYDHRMPEFDLVVGIKDGSPLLAAHVSRIIGKPLVLHRGPQDPKPLMEGGETFFDGAIESRSSCLIVDDSSTGGRMVLDCIGALANRGAVATAVAVLFEPLGKNARRRVENRNVKFVSCVAIDDQAHATLNEGAG